MHEVLCTAMATAENMSDKFSLISEKYLFTYLLNMLIRFGFSRIQCCKGLLNMYGVIVHFQSTKINLLKFKAM